MNANGQTAADGWHGMQGAYGLPQNPGMNVQQPVYVRGTDMSRYATVVCISKTVVAVLQMG